VVVGVNVSVGAGVTGDSVAVSSAVVLAGVAVKLEQASMIKAKRLTMIFMCFLCIFSSRNAEKLLFDQPFIE
jgi:hypothetical protein